MRSPPLEEAAAFVSWTNHIREHGLLSEDHQRQHTTEQLSQDTLSRAHWEFHQREHESSMRAVDKVEAAMETRFAAVNEFREQLREQTRAFLTRNEYVAAHDPLLTRMAAVETVQAQNVGRDKGAQPYTAVIFSVISAVLSALAVGAVVIATRPPGQ